MDSGVCCKSDESLATSDEYEFVASSSDYGRKAASPRLQIGTTATDLETTLDEVLLETQLMSRDEKSKLKCALETVPSSLALDLKRDTSDFNICSSMSSSSVTEGTGFCSLDNLDIDDTSGTTASSTEGIKFVGGSKFYNPLDEGGNEPVSPKEKQDHMKPTESDEEVSDVDQECTVFSGVSYLGAAAINAPTSKVEIQRNMAMLSEQKESEMGIAVSVSIPTCSQGLVVLYDANTNAVMARYAVHQILFYARGAAATPQASCFAFTWSHGDPKESAIFQCHVFRCQIAEAVTHVSNCFAKAFERVPRSMTSSMTSDCTMSGSLLSAPNIPDMTTVRQLMHVLECNMEIKEHDSKGTFSTVPKDRTRFKLRAGIDKQVVITVQQVQPSNQSLSETQQNMTTCVVPGSGFEIERCFGVLLAKGRNVKLSDMTLLEMVNSESSGKSCSVTVFWKASQFPNLNVGMQDPRSEYVTIAVDLVIRGMREPVRLIIETQVKVFMTSERFWYYSKRPLIQQFFIYLKEKTDNYGLQYEVTNIESTSEIDRSISMTLSLSSLLPSPLTSQPAPPSPDDEISDGDEPLLSGTGEVSKDCREDVLENWAQVLRSWSTERPKPLSSLVKLGIPEALRGEVWQRLAGVDGSNPLMDTYRVLITKECSCEGVIQRDIARTFPAHDYFREAGGLGQDSLLRLARAYAVYDIEVGYCQGLSFVAATLLLHMPEEQAFCVLVKLMYDYKLRDLYKDGFEVLTLRLYQLNRLMGDHVGDLRDHFISMGVEPHMFASQWFLTLFTARFPLPFVFHIVDVFLLQGMDTLFQIALSLLLRFKKDLMLLDFEGILKYFRVTLPKKCRGEEVSRYIIKQACSIKVKRLAKYQQDFENLTKEVVETEQMGNELEQLKSQNEQLIQEKEYLSTQLNEAREALKRESEKSACDTKISASIAQEYKEICSRLDQQLAITKDTIRGCNSCNTKLNASDNKKAENIMEGDVGLHHRIKELELELAQVKLAHVEALCENQELRHQINSAAVEQQNAIVNQKQSWPPWFSKTLGSIKEAAQNSRPSLQTYLSSTFIMPDGEQSASGRQIKKRDSLPPGERVRDKAHPRRDSEPSRVRNAAAAARRPVSTSDVAYSSNRRRYESEKSDDCVSTG